MIGPSPPAPTGSEQPIPSDGSAGARSAGPWIAVAIMALGFVLLVGGVGFVVVRALRMAPTGPSAGVASAAPSVAVVVPAPSSAAPEPAKPELVQPDRAPPAPKPSGTPRVSTFPPGSHGAVAIPVSAGRPALGAAEPDVTLSLFGDLECPFTLRTLRQAAKLVERHAGALRFVFYHHPLDAGVDAVAAARRVALAALRGGPELGWEMLERRARADGRWQSEPGAPPNSRGEPSAAESRALDRLLAEDEELGSVLDVRATPTLFVNGLRLVGEPDADLLESAIQREERSVRWMRAQGVPAERAYALRLRRNLIAVDTGAADRSCLPQGDAPEQGPGEALVTLVEFSGFECRVCRHFEPALGELANKYPRAFRRVFRGVAPRDAGSARRALAFAMSAQTELGDAAFWSLFRALRSSPSRLDDQALFIAAKQAGLDAERLFAAVDDEKHQRRLSRDLELARTLDVESTPTFFVNGRKLPRDVSPEALKAAVAEELAAAKRIQRAGTPPSRFGDLLCGTAGNTPESPGAARTQ